MGYLSLDPEDTASSFLESLAESRIRFLWMTADRPAAKPVGGDLLRVTTIRRGLGTVDPRRLQDLRVAATAFLDENGPGVLLVDCLTPLVLHSGIERVLRFVDDLHEEVAMRDANLVVFADRRALNRRMVAWLERELDPLPRAVETVGVEGRVAG